MDIIKAIEVLKMIRNYYRDVRKEDPGMDIILDHMALLLGIDKPAAREMYCQIRALEEEQYQK